MAVATGEFDIVIGTQLVAKGHNFPGMTLVGVIDADLGLTSGDPRAAERTFQVLRQVTGRAGRGERPGRALLQTHDPTHPVLKALISGDPERFYAAETASREAAGLPPFGRLAGLIVSASEPGRGGGACTGAGALRRGAGRGLRAGTGRSPARRAARAPSHAADRQNRARGQPAGLSARLAEAGRQAEGLGPGRGRCRSAEFPVRRQARSRTLHTARAWDG